jgi:hypothetical protein
LFPGYVAVSIEIARQERGDVGIATLEQKRWNALVS